MAEVDKTSPESYARETHYDGYLISVPGETLRPVSNFYSSSTAFTLDHPQVEVEVCDGGVIRTVEVDVKIAPLLSKLWEAGIRSLCSCQGGDSSLAYILFSSPEDADKFRNMLQEDPWGEKQLKEALLEARLNENDDVDLAHWVYEAPMSVVRFPHAHLARITQLFSQPQAN